MVKGITYSDEKMTISQGVCIKSMKENGISDAIGYYPWLDLGDTFNWLNKDILSAERGCGYWLWKPLIIANTMKDMKDNDILIYSDAGVEWINSAQHIIDVMDQDIFLFTSGHLEHEYTKMDVAIKILGYMPENKEQVHASVIFIRVSEWSRRFIKEWLCFCQIPGMITDEPSRLPNHADFKDHRHDQSILSLLARREGLYLHYWPDELWFSTQRHRWPEDKYPLMFRHHRKRNNEW